MQTEGKFIILERASVGIERERNEDCAYSVEHLILGGFVSGIFLLRKKEK